MRWCAEDLGWALRWHGCVVVIERCAHHLPKAASWVMLSCAQKAIEVVGVIVLVGLGGMEGS